MTLRSLTRAALLLVAAACAQMDPPPGGPEDRMPPYVVAQEPDSLAVVPDWNQPAVFRFSERISEQQVEEAVMVSPRTSPVLVDRGSREIRVSLRGGWEPGQIYHVTLRPLVQDLFNNRIDQPVAMVFSTGPAIPDTRLSGVVRDRITGEPQADARVEAIRRADSLVYAVPSDSVGEFRFAHVPEGEYLIRAFPDPNRNRSLDPFEERDSLTASISTADAAPVELSIVLPDSTPPAIASISAGVERRVEVRFDDYLDPAQMVDVGSVTITGPDAVAVAIARVTVGEPPEADPDSVGATRPDTLAAVADTVVLVTESDTVPGADGDTVLAAQADTLIAVEPALPSQLLVVELEDGVELIPEAEYSVAVVGIRNVVGLAGDSEEQFTAPQPPPPPDAAPDDPDADPLREPAPADAQGADTIPALEPPPGR